MPNQSKSVDININLKRLDLSNNSCTLKFRTFSHKIGFFGRDHYVKIEEEQTADFDEIISVKIKTSAKIAVDDFEDKVSGIGKGNRNTVVQGDLDTDKKNQPSGSFKNYRVEGLDK